MELNQHGEVMSLLGNVRYGNFSMSVYVFYIDHMLVDTGASRMLQVFKPFYLEHAIEFVSLTHVHEDHTGTAAWLQREKNVPIYIRKEAIEDCEREATLPLYREKIWGDRKPFSPLPYGDEIQCNKHTYDVIHTPGHEKNHTVLFDKDRGRLFSGDLYLHDEPKVIMESESINDMIQSIQEVLKLDFQEMFCQHSGFIPNGKEALQRKLNYLEDVKGRVMMFHHKGYSIKEINNLLFSTAPKIVEHSNHEYDTRHIIRSIIEGSNDS
ncbi:beta-lactamase [Pontibacillus halophilus JSM 076056 = DSM 19796]|uniref:Beta-lactamase n=1 Tax=Pontibacillus halophilus JSM 076056 = DSM 19796 TaxID=1385510 RepID=A0A0A5I880_9BACI|nr:MBL fold metallo-hydrolase [Pontibacillus halophilus]KGX92022.1 beta-lactamase [Pontibacillus halophilus JSM 076056 = DSM 19796]